MELVPVLVVVAGMAAGAFLKGITGSGLPVIAIPVMASFVGVEEAVVVMTIPGVVTNTWLMWHHRRRRYETRDLPALLITGILGVAVGAWLLKELETTVLSLILAAIIFLYVATYFVNQNSRVPPQVSRYAAPPVGVAAGVLQGATGMSGPVLSAYLHSYRLDQRAYVFSITTLFQVFAAAQIVALAVLGLYSWRRLGLSLLAVLPIMAVMPLGTKLSGRLSRRRFDVIVLSVLVASAVKLVLDAL